MFMTKTTRLLFTFVLLASSQLLLFKFITLMVDLSLPYDVSWYDYWGWPASNPPVDSWQRNLTYFLSSPVGSVLPAVVATLISIGLFGAVLLRHPVLRGHTVRFALFFMLATAVSIPLTFAISYVTTAYFCDRLTNWPLAFVAGWLPLAAGVIGLFVMQGYVIPHKCLGVLRGSYQESRV